MHPIEHLRYIARSSGADQRTLVHETASALRALGDDPAGLLVGCRRLIERHPESGALWWLAATLLTSSDPRSAARQAAATVVDDTTPDVLVAELPDGVTVCVLGWPDLAGDAVIRRGDVSVVAVDTSDGGRGSELATARDLVRRLEQSEVDVELAAAAGVGAAATSVDVVLVEAFAASPEALLAERGSLAAASAAYCAGVPVWGVVGRGRVLPEAAFVSVAGRSTAARQPWESRFEVVPLALLTDVVDHRGRRAAASAPLVPECAAVPELLRPIR
ncbi:MAG: hypothetical protein ACO3C1_04445 [Ilumatobacteraceae bacterium]